MILARRTNPRGDSVDVRIASPGGWSFNLGAGPWLPRTLPEPVELTGRALEIAQEAMRPCSEVAGANVARRHYLIPLPEDSAPFQLSQFQDARDLNLSYILARKKRGKPFTEFPMPRETYSSRSIRVEAGTEYGSAAVEIEP